VESARTGKRGNCSKPLWLKGFRRTAGKWPQKAEKGGGSGKLAMDGPVFMVEEWVFCFGSSPELGGRIGMNVPRGTIATFGKLRPHLDRSMFHVEQKEAEDGSWQT
jgi:hypothetical protein